MKQIKSRKAQRGLSLLMTMALIAIIGILAEVALSAYEDHVAQAKAAEAVTSEEHWDSSISTYWNSKYNNGERYGDGADYENKSCWAASSELGASKSLLRKTRIWIIVGPIGPEPVAVMEHPTGININFILNASDDASEVNVLMDVPEKHTGFTHISLEITDRKAVERHLNEAGIPITETVDLPDGAVFFFIRDPDGNVIEFHQPG